MKHYRHVAALVLTSSLIGQATKPPPKAAPPKAAPPNAASSMLAAALRHDLKDVREIVFANRTSYDDSHWYANIGYYCDDETKPARAGNGRSARGRLCKLDLRTRELTVLVDAGSGSIRDPTVHYDGAKILFAWRKDGTDHYHLHEIGVDGTGLRRITAGPFDDFEPTYLPDDDIAFVSTRCRRWVNCWTTQVGILYRCGPNGDGIRRISANIEHDNTPAVLPDGRILFTRWEYVDRSQVGYHHLWTMNPDGTGQRVYYGNQRHYPLYIDAHPIPGTASVVGVESPGHGRRDHYGAVGIFSEAHGPNERQGYRRISRGRNFIDPHPISADLFLVASGKRILLMDGSGQTEAIHTSDHPCHEPCPIAKRPREKIVATARRPGTDSGQLIVTDVYEGRNMTGVARGDIKKLLVLETLPKPVNFSGGPDLTSWLGTFTLERVLGTVPVEEDGSASFELPAGRAFFFVALDENDMSIKRMQSFVNVMPGETRTCIGCHEQRTVAPRVPSTAAVAALRRPPSRIEPFAGHPDVLDFTRDIQPILDRHCVECHDWKTHAGSLSLEGDLGMIWSIPYYSLIARLQVADGRNGYGNQPPRTIGSSASRLMDKIDGSHHDVKVSAPEWRRVWLWLESAAPYAGTYAALRNGAETSLSGHGKAVFRAGGVVRRRCASCHGVNGLPRIPFAPRPHPYTRGIERPTARHERLVIEDDPLARFSAHVILNLSRPELSAILLAPLSEEAGGWGTCGEVFADRSDRDYRALLRALRAEKKKRDSIPRYTTPGWRPNRQYIREMKRFGVLPRDFAVESDATGAFDPFATDQRYWRKLWDY